ncbi:DUF6215 domain-containing protein [Streptomyces sp. NPDC059989]|uniref:DUF6215 domain-containing protein n=1 Tax=Streptomyces sp. NPDC059989 TaxID=3347026 RepID=UPI0036A59F36
MAEDNDASNRGARAWGQALAAVVLIPGLGFGMWAWEEYKESLPPVDWGLEKPAACSGGEREKGYPHPYLSGAELCEALNRPDLADLLGTPGERAKSAGGSGGSFKTSGGREIAMPSARVEFETYTVTLGASYGNLPVARSATLLGDTAPPRTVLGRPAALYSDRTIQLSFRLDGSDSSSAPGVPARVLTVARDASDNGDSFDVTLWRKDGALPDDAVVLRVAETLLPTVPRWTPAG